ncbi:MAG: tRNA uridine-5-carboxymethylaminomethyl(34) synthesis GTPase MnmE [Clostridiaceae bacterium]|nr:tRNA uridine-5-carboxymethylaminomethyl(34) synthesis GTPase MnmE [Clostridiaceae bacterium]
MLYNDTIAAVSTPYGSGGIGIVRISGDKAFEIAEKIFKGKRSVKEMKSHTINYGKIIDDLDGSVLDEVLLTKMEKPNTFTREDVVEINCHGGIIVLKKVLELVTRHGARLAGPGEFTKRAFLNGRIDLAQAEAVIDIINAKTALSSKAALAQLEGALSEKIKEIRDELVELVAHVESTLDFPEEDFDKITGESLYKGMEKAREELSGLLSKFDKGKVIMEGVNAVIIGRPNVGKSSLLNRLTGRNRAIVTDIPGTTRDTIEEYINMGGIPLNIIDTAGIRETSDLVEKIGAEKTMKAIESADLVIMMIDTGEGFTPADAAILQLIGEKKKIIMLNKIDLVEKQEDLKGANPNSRGLNGLRDSRLEGNELIDNKLSELIDGKIKGNGELKGMIQGAGIAVIKSSMKDGRGMEELEKEISRLFMEGEIEAGIEGIMTNVRHASLVEKALNSVNDAISAYHANITLDCIAIDIRNAVNYLGEITGENISDEILERIFSRFCIGK